MSGLLFARLDSVGDVLLTGPAVRACAARRGPVTFLASSTGAAAAALLPGVGRVIEVDAPWIAADPGPVRPEAVDHIVESVRTAAISVAVIATSFHQSPLPLALLMRLAGVGRVGAISVDYPGSLLDVRHSVPDDLHEVERNLSLVEAMGFSLPPGDDRSLRVDQDAVANAVSPGAEPPSEPGHVVVHPGASVPARTWSARRYRELVRALNAEGFRVVVTGGAAETEITAGVAGTEAIDLGGRLDLAQLAAVIGRARVLVAGNTGPAHLAAAVGTPVVSLYAPTVPAVRWRPWQIPHVLLGDQDIACAGCRARVCPVPGHPCLETVGVHHVVQGVRSLLPDGWEPDGWRAGAARPVAGAQL